MDTILLHYDLMEDGCFFAVEALHVESVNTLIVMVILSRTSVIPLHPDVNGNLKMSSIVES